MLSWYLVPNSPYIFYYPQVTIFSGQAPPLFKTAAATQITNSNFLYNKIDTYAVADFNKDGYPDVLLHGFNGNPNEYYLLPGTAGNAFDTTSQDLSPDVAQISCSNCNSFALSIIADDFNDDGYPDVAYSTQKYVTPNPGVDYPVVTYPIGVALNGGAGSSVTFPSAGFHSAPAVTDGIQGDTFTPTALASGHFTSSGHADLVVAGYFVSPKTDPTTGTTTGTRVQPITSNMVLFLGKGDGTFSDNPAVFNASNGTTPAAVATADLRGNSMTDVVLANTPGTATATNNVQVLFGDGKGGLTTSSTVTVPIAPASLTIRDFNNDSYPDILVTGTDGSLNLILNDGTGHFSTATAIGTPFKGSSLTTSGDFNGDGLADIAEITSYSVNKVATSTPWALLNSASSQAALDTPPKTLPAGTDTLTASFPSDNNFARSMSAGVDVTVTQTVPTINWPPPQPIQYPTALSATQLNASASVPGTFTYSPAAGKVPPLGQTTDTAVFAPTDIFDYSSATTMQTITVIPPPVTATATGPETTETAQSDSASLTVNSYPLDITPTVTLSFTPAPPITVSDPAVLFTNDGTTEMLPTIPANSTTSLPIDFNTGSTAGTITLTITLMAVNPTTGQGTNVTPSALVPLNISLPAAPPVIKSVQLTRSGQTMTAVITGLSSTRDMTLAHFHFTPAPGKDLKTTDLTVDLAPSFGYWYGLSNSDTYGTNFLYTQPFTLNSDATTVGSVAVTLTNSKGDSQPSTAQ